MIPFKRSIVNVRKINRPLQPSARYFESLPGERRARPCLYSTSATLFKATVTRTTKSLAELPSHKVDNEGNRIGPLPPYIDGKAKKTTKGKGNKGTKRKGVQDAPRVIADTEASPSDLTAQYKAAVVRGEVPDTPLAEEVYTNWKRFPDAILLTRVGKFYESYFAPAVDLSNLLSLKLAYKKYSGGNFPFSGFPVTQIDKYLKILVQDLRRTVVLVEEYDEEGRREPFDPIRKVATGSGAELKDRRVGRVVTPGTLVEETWVSGDESRYLLAVAVEDAPNGGETRISLAYTDPSTGEFFLKDTTAVYLEDEMARIAPREVVLDVRNKSDWMSGDQTDISARSELDDLFQLLRVLGIHVSFADPRRPFSEDSPDAVTTMLPAVPLETQAISILRHHLQYALRDSMPELTSPNKQSSGKTMLIDAATLAALEIRHAIRPGGLVTFSDTFGGASPLSARGTLLSTMSQTMTPSGHRLIVRTLTAPSTDIDAINTRLDLVEEFVDREELRTDLRDMIRGIADVMRIVQRFKGRRGDERDAWDVGTWIRAVERVKQRLLRDLGDGESGLEPLRTFVQSFKPLFDLADLIEGSLDEAAVMKQGLSVVVEVEDGEEMEIQAGDAMVAESSGKKGETKKEQQDREKAAREQKWFMKTHFSAELKAMHEALEKMQDQRAKMQRDLQKQLGVEKLELTKNRNTFVMSLSARLDFAKIDKLRQFANILETKSGKSYAYNPWSALGAKTERHMEDMQFAQRRAFDQLRDMIVARAEHIQHNAALMDELDVCLSFAQTAADLGYVRPELDDSTDLEIIDGRHPTVESSLLNSSRSFTPNSTHMDPSSHLHIITGPNQGGKSTLLRQTAVIAILAQAGSFVPASHVRMGIVDRVFSRIGARDDLFRDRSTFMLEMVETAAILRHATERSLVIMDEIGRGTTLHSGLSIAYATLDHILTKIRCRTLFATHYHEVADMLSLNEQVRDGVEFWCTDVDEVDGAFSYQYRLQRGINHKSHAIKAARLAGMPDSFLQTASNTLDALDSDLKPGEAVRPDNEEPRSGGLV